MHVLETSGEDFGVNTTTQEPQIAPWLTILGGQAYVVWEDYSGAGLDSSGTAVRFRLLPPLW